MKDSKHVKGRGDAYVFLDNRKARNPGLGGQPFNPWNHISHSKLQMWFFDRQIGYASCKTHSVVSYIVRTININVEILAPYSEV